MSARTATAPQRGEVKRHYRAWLDLRKRHDGLPYGTLGARYGTGERGRVLVAVYNREMQGNEDDPTVGRYEVSCDDHDRIVYVPDLRAARNLQTYPGVFCGVCQGTEEPDGVDA